MNIRRTDQSDRRAVWEIFKDVVSHGDTYVFSPDISEQEALAYWMSDNTHCYVAEENGTILGTYIIKNNQPALGAHVANASFMVHKDARGKGVGEIMGKSALKEAKRLGYKSMQFNLVVATNTGAIKLWQKLGFKIIGTAPEAFKHKSLGFVDAHIMYRHL